MDMFLVFIVFLLGCAIGIGFYICFEAAHADEPAGVIRIDRSDTDGPYFFLEIENLSDITDNEYITLQVVDENFSPQK